jgi:Tol biopolymer transport system component
VVAVSLKNLKTFGARRFGGLSLSPDGKYVVYHCQRDIYLLATDGSSEATLVEHPADDWAPFWAPDGKRIVFASDRSGSKDLWILDVVDGKPKGAPTFAKTMGPRFRPLGFTADGSFYYGVGTLASDIYVATLDFEAGKVIASPTKTSLRFEGSNYKPFWSRDGKYLAYASSRGNGTFLVIRSIESGHERDIATDAGLLRWGWGRSQWSPEGSSILLTGGHLKWGESVYLLDLETEEATLILPREEEEGGRKRSWPRSPVFSNDGKQIFYHRQSDTPGSRSIVVHDLETRRERELYKTTNLIGRLAVSPDGQRLAFFEAEQSLQSTVLKTISTSGGDARELYTLEDVNVSRGLARGVRLTWMPDGRHVLVGGPDGPDDQAELWRIPVTGGEPSKLNLGFEFNHLVLHPDGKRIAFTGRDPKGRGEVWRMENFLP